MLWGVLLSKVGDIAGILLTLNVQQMLIEDNWFIYNLTLRYASDKSKFKGEWINAESITDSKRINQFSHFSWMFSLHYFLAVDNKFLSYSFQISSKINFFVITWRQIQNHNE